MFSAQSNLVKGCIVAFCLPLCRRMYSWTDTVGYAQVNHVQCSYLEKGYNAQRMPNLISAPL